MPFTDESHMSSAIREDALLAIRGPDGGAFFEALAQAEALITGKTGVAPLEAVESNHAILRNCAASIVVWTLTGRQSDVSAEEIDRRRSQYNDAIRTLDGIADGTIKLTTSATAVAPECDSRSRRVQRW